MHSAPYVYECTCCSIGLLINEKIGKKERRIKNKERKRAGKRENIKVTKKKEQKRGKDLYEKIVLESENNTDIVLKKY